MFVVVVCFVVWLCFVFFSFSHAWVSNCTSLHFKESKAWVSLGYLVFRVQFYFFSWYFWDSGARGTGAESSLWQPFHISIAQVPTKPVLFLCHMSKGMGDSIVTLHNISPNQDLRRRNGKLSACVVCRSDSFIHPFLPTSPTIYLQF